MSEELKNRRNNLFNAIEDNSLVLIYSGVSKIRSEDSLYPFHANRHFFYLTGIDQENSVLMMIKTQGERKVFLFIDEYNELKERWTGKRLRFDVAGRMSDIENVYTNNNLESMIDMALANDKAMYGHIDNFYLDLSDEIKVATNKSTQMLKNEFEARYVGLKVENVYPIITSLRMVKSKEEVDNIVEAINITNTGINDLLLQLRFGMYEYELSYRFEYYGRTHGRRELAFETICAAGRDATIMHHPISQQTTSVKDGDLVLFDLGYQYNGYSADISRTYPVNGVFSEKQRKVYQSVLNCNKAVIAYAKPGLLISDLQDYAKKVLKEECVKNGLLKQEDDIVKYYIHNVSHHLGLDTHDASDRTKPLAPGNVITVEPGLYFVDEGIGVRIEDDVLITEEGATCLSKGIVKEIAEIEKLFKTKRSGI